MKNILEILETSVEQDYPIKSLTLLSMVRKGSTTDSLEISLGTTEKWISVPISLIISANEIGNHESEGKFYKVVELVIKSPNEQNIWFDYLAHVLHNLKNIECNAADTHSDCENVQNSTNKLVPFRLSTGRRVYKRLACMYNGYSIRWCSQHGM